MLRREKCYVMKFTSDSLQAENVLQLLQARTAAAADSALAGLKDGVGKAVVEMRFACLQVRGQLSVNCVRAFGHHIGSYFMSDIGSYIILLIGWGVCLHTLPYAPLPLPIFLAQSICSQLQLLAELEARLDFDEDMPSMDLDRLKGQIEALQGGIESALRTARQSTLLRQGLQAS